MTDTHLIHELAVVCAKRRQTSLVDFRDRYELAWGAIAEAYSVGERYRGALITVGLRAISDERGSFFRHHGLPNKAWHQNGRRFAMYWHGPLRLEAPFVEPILDIIALNQIWWKLSEKDREILAGLAWHCGDVVALARTHRVHPGTMKTWIVRARQHARALWHDWEKAPSHYGRATTARWQGLHDPDKALRNLVQSHRQNYRKRQRVG